MNQTFALKLAVALLFGSLICGDCVAQRPEKLTDAQIKKLVFDGDRLADQADYLNALRKYTTAYIGVVSQIRGQDFSERIEPQTFTREDLAKEMLEQLEKEYTDEELELMDKSFKALGLVPPELKTEEVMTKMLTEEVAGFYDPDNKRMVLIVEEGSDEQPSWLGRLLGARPAFDKDEQKTTLAHELTHALQDQLYDLNAMQDGIEADDDMLLAFSALVEGDATLLMFAEAQGGDIEDMDPAAMRATFSIMSWMLPLAGGETFRQAPPIFRDSLTFPYLQGMLYTLGLAGEGGWPKIHAAYKNPPTSTEQILHPEKYLNPDEWDVPQEIALPEITSMMDQGWKHLGGNCLGELQMSIMLKSVFGGSNAARGWDGDRYEVYESDAGDLALCMVSVWDSEKDAQEFSEAYLKFREADPQKANAVFAEGAQRQMQVKRNVVYVCEGLSMESAQAALSELVDHCQICDKHFPMPSAQE